MLSRFAEVPTLAVMVHAVLVSTAHNLFCMLSQLAFPNRVVANLGFARTGVEGGVLGTPVDLPQSGLDFRSQPSDRIQNIELLERDSEGT